MFDTVVTAGVMICVLAVIGFFSVCTYLEMDKNKTYIVQRQETIRAVCTGDLEKDIARATACIQMTR